jgi:hypothetical protein
VFTTTTTTTTIITTTITTSCFLGLNQHNNSVPYSTLLDFVFTSSNVMTCISITNYPLVASDNYHLPLNLDFKLTFDCQSTLTPQRKYGQGDYLFLYNTSSKL